ncbi:MAG: porin family protein [Alphaproteobacteria bacterium]|nr:porin family protein [Alphaproteobacteria bacterium]
MKQPVLAAAAVAALACGTLAFSGLARAQFGAPATPSSALWSGFYVGVNGGANVGDSTTSVSTALTFDNSFLTPEGQTYGPTATRGASGSPSVGSTRFIGGGQLGINFPIGQMWMAGVEADIDGQSGSSSATINNSFTRPGFAPDVVNTSLATTKQLNWLSTVRARFGVMFQPSWWLYATGGLAIGDVSSSTHLTATEAPNTGSTDVSATGQSAKTSPGFTVGGGLEWLLGQRWSLKAEYLYYRLGSLTYSNTPFSAFLNGTTTVDFNATSTSRVRFNGNIIRLGLNYHF